MTAPGEVIDEVGARRARMRTRSRGRLREFPGVAEAVGLGLAARAALPIGSDESRLRALFKAARWVESEVGRQVVRAALSRAHILQRGDLIRDRRIGWERYESSDFDGRSRVLSASLVLKEPGPGGELGVLYSAFEYNWMRLLANYDARRLLDEYLLVGATSWSPTDYAHLASFAGLSEHPVFPGISHETDIEGYGMLSPLVRPVPCLASDWVDPSHFTPRPPGERDVDVLMVANFLPFKRHWLLFQALRGMSRTLRVVLVGLEAPGRTAEDLRREARLFGVRQDVEIVANAPIDLVARFQEAARISLVFSHREGSCVAVAESLFADTPVGLFHDAHIGSRRYVNRETGRLLGYRNLARQLSEFLEHSTEYRPRAWALGRISCHESSATLNAMLRDYSNEIGRPWTRDIAPLCWRPRPMYVSNADADRLAPARARLFEEHGVELSVPPGGWSPADRSLTGDGRPDRPSFTATAGA